MQWLIFKAGFWEHQVKMLVYHLEFYWLSRDTEKTCSAVLSEQYFPDNKSCDSDQFNFEANYCEQWCMVELESCYSLNGLILLLLLLLLLLLQLQCEFYYCVSIMLHFFQASSSAVKLMRTDFCLLDHLAAMRVSYKTIKNNNNDFVTKHNNNYYYYAGLKTSQFGETNVCDFFSSFFSWQANSD